MHICVKSNPVRYICAVPKLPKNRTCYASTPGDFASCYYRLDGRLYVIIQCGYEIRNGQKWYYQDVKNDKGEYKRFGHDELRQATKAATFITREEYDREKQTAKGKGAGEKGNLIDLAPPPPARSQTAPTDPPGAVFQNLKRNAPGLYDPRTRMRAGSHNSATNNATYSRKANVTI